MRSDVIRRHSNPPIVYICSEAFMGLVQTTRRTGLRYDGAYYGMIKKITYKTVSVERRDHIASPLHYGTWPRDSLLARSEPVRQSG